MKTQPVGEEHHIYEGPGDDLMAQVSQCEPADGGAGVGRIILLPDAPRERRDPDPVQRIRIMWGQRLIDDLIAGRYRTLVCAVNARDNSHGFINQLAGRLPSSQWDEASITEHARHFAQPQRATVVKYDMDPVEVIALLRPRDHEHLTLDDLAHGFRTAAALLHCRPDRYPSASVCFLGARANRLVGAEGHEPCFETVLSVMYRAGYRGDVYPAPWMWESAPRGVFPRYPFPDTLREMCEGGS
jgi:hypothetical protein